MKKVFSALLIVFMIMSLVGCGSKEASGGSGADKKDENAKGTRNNPYSIGETVEIKNVISKSYASPYDNEPFDIILKINKAYSIDEGISIRNEQGIESSHIPCAEMTFSMEGKYQDSVELADLLQVGAIDDQMQNNDGGFDTKDASIQVKVFTGSEYTIYVLGPYDMFENKGTQTTMICFSYWVPDATDQEHVYISLK